MLWYSLESPHPDNSSENPQRFHGEIRKLISLIFLLYTGMIT